MTKERPDKHAVLNSLAPERKTVRIVCDCNDILTLCAYRNTKQVKKCKCGKEFFCLINYTVYEVDDV